MTQEVHLHKEGKEEVILPDDPDDFRKALVYALESDEAERRENIASVVAKWPAILAGWVALAHYAHDDISAYAFRRVAYHRGLDLLRKNGWRGRGYVKWEHPTNRPFLEALDGLRESAEIIEEKDEAARCDEFLHQLDPNWDRRTG